MRGKGGRATSQFSERADYGPTGRIYDLEEAIRAAYCFMQERDANGAPFLSGMFTHGEVLYASGQDGRRDREPIAIFTGEVLLPAFAGDLDDDAVRDLLNELAGEIGSVLEQEEVHVGYRDRIWTLRRSNNRSQAAIAADRSSPNRCCSHRRRHSPKRRTP